MQKLVVVDFETGGLDFNTDSVLSLGAAIWVDGEITNQFHMYINEGDVHTHPDAMKVNGITEEQIKAGMTPSFTVTAFEDWLHTNGVTGRATLGGHNIAGFDMNFMRRLYRLAGRRMPFDYHTIDTMSVALFLKFMGVLDVPNVKLDTLCKHFGIVIRAEGAPHKADEDAVATAKLLTALMDVVDVVKAGGQIERDETNV